MHHPLSNLLLCALTAASAASAQQIHPALTLPDAPSASLQQTSSSTQQLAATLTGTVHAADGSAVFAATITLTSAADSRQTATTDTNGSFTFQNLPPGAYRLQIAASGLAPATLPALSLTPGERYTLPPVTLTLASVNSSIDVNTSQNQIALEEVRAEEHQRVLGILPSFYTSYVWTAAPLPAHEKYSLAAHSAFDPVAFIGIGIGAGIQQAHNTYPGYGQGAAGYGRRFGAGFGDETIGRFFASAIYPSIFHQDPRYFYKGTGSVKARALYAITRTIVTRGDNGRSEPNYSLILGRFTAGGLSNLYHDASDRSAGLTFENAFLNLAGNAADNLIREFVLRRLTPKVPDYANGQAAPAKP